MLKQVQRDNLVCVDSLVWVRYVPLPYIVIARLGKAEAIQYKHLNHFINVFIRKNCLTGLLRSARNDGSGDKLDCFALLAMTREEDRPDCFALLAMTGIVV